MHIWGHSANGNTPALHAGIEGSIPSGSTINLKGMINMKRDIVGLIMMMGVAVLITVAKIAIYC